MADFVAWITDLTDDYHLTGERLERKAKSWLKLLGPGFFQDELPYVVRIVCLIRADRRDSIKADEILRVAEKVYGLPVNLWTNETAWLSADPEVWSVHDSEWVSLKSALQTLFENQTYFSRAWKTEQYREEFNKHQPELCQLIYGGYPNA